MDIILTPGTYYVGDPSYVTKGNEGYHWIEKMWKELYDTKDKYIYTTIDNVELFVGRTYGGDGVFKQFYVDSGAISFIKTDNLSNDSRFNFRNFSIKGAKFITLDTESTLTYNKGDFQVEGLLEIKTNIE